MANVLEEWVTELAEALEVDPGVLDRDALLHAARDAAHQVARPAAPLTTFLIGYAAGSSAAGSSAAGAEAVQRAAGVASRLAARRGGAASGDDRG
jgi:hypothetical protein